MGTQRLDNFYQKLYFQKNYNPKKYVPQLKESQYPKEKHLKGLYWYSTQKEYCHSMALKMLFQDYDNDVNFYNWITGFTYGFTFKDNLQSLRPYNDPELGIPMASNYMGYTSTYIKAKSYDEGKRIIVDLINREIPIKVPVDYCILTEKDGFIPHTEVIIGYDESGVYIYETGEEDREIMGSLGIHYEYNKFFKSIERISEYFGYPWILAMMMFERKLDYNKEFYENQILMRNGKSLVGFRSGPYIQGSYGIEEFAECIVRNQSVTSDELLKIVSKLAYIRGDNALFLLRSKDDNMRNAGEYMKEASIIYKEVINLFHSENKPLYYEECKKMLILASNVEYKCGLILQNLKE